MNEFKERLEELLLEKGISRLKLANSIGVSSTTINGYFNDGYYPQIDIALKISEFFGCSLDYLFGLSDKRTNKERNSNSFFENLKNLMENKIIVNVMKDLNMSENNYYRWRDGKFPKTINLIDVARYFDVSIDYLVGKGK